MIWAYGLGKRTLPEYSNKFSRHDFTLPQLFACLVLREHQKKSYRGVEALLRDCPHWCKGIGMAGVPDHNTLCRAFHVIRKQRIIDRMLDLLARWMSVMKLLGDTCAIDSTLYDTHHRSRHYEQRCRHYASRDKSTANSRRSRSAKRTPKLSVGVDTNTHLILSTRARTGMGSDALDFIPLLRDAKRRRRGIKTVLADAGYDSHENHRLAREQLRIRALIKTGCGRPSAKPPASSYRRRMRSELEGSQKGKPYGQRAQVETVNSMLKRNLGDHLRARSAVARQFEQLLRVVTHNLMIW